MPKHFNIVRKVGDPMVATTSYGTVVHREEKLFFPYAGWKRFVTCAPYDNHFIFEEKKHIGPTLWCTCGSYAAIVGSNVYKQDASATDTGELIVCWCHAALGRHADGSK